MAIRKITDCQGPVLQLYWKVALFVTTMLLFVLPLVLLPLVQFSNQKQEFSQWCTLAFGAVTPRKCKKVKFRTYGPRLLAV